MALYLIDYDNTVVRGITVIERLRSTDRLIILYGPKTGSVPFEDMVKMTSSPAAVEFVRTTKTAKNYLDFQLSTYLGYLVAKRASQEYYIISRDSGFDAVLDFWQEKEVRISRFVNLLLETAEETAVKKPAAKKTQEKKPAQKSPAGRKKADAGNAQQEQPVKDESKQEPKKEQKKEQKKELKKEPIRNVVTEADVPQKNTQSVPTVPESVKKKVRSALKEEELKAGAYRKVYMCMLESNEKSALNTSLVHAFGQETGNKYYKLILTAFSAWRSPAHNEQSAAKRR